MFLGRAAVGRRHRVKKKRARREIDNRGARDPHRIDVAAWELV